MKITYDESVDAAYIYLTDHVKADLTYPIDVNLGEINLDFDKDRCLVGIEVLSASKKLPAAIIESAEKI